MTTTLRDEYDVAVVGAGPAGLAAASLCARSKLLTALLDDQPGPGGRMYHAITETPLRERSILGRDFWAGEKIAREILASGADYVHGATVTGLTPQLEIAVSIGGRSSRLHARRVILAVGALERPVAFEGSTLAGVVTLGAAQRRLQSSGRVPPGSCVIAGNGPLVWRAAERMLNAGAAVTAILDTTPTGNRLRALPHLPGFLFSPYLRDSIAVMRSVRQRARVEPGATQLHAEGANGKLSEVSYVNRSGAWRTLPADNLLVHEGVVPNVALTRAAGIELRWNAEQLLWEPVIGPGGVTSVPGIYVSGDTAGIAGGQAAAWRGVITASAVIAAVRPDLARASQKIALEALARFMRGRRYLDLLHQPPVGSEGTE
jgi:octopine oxidase subunit A